MGAPRSVLRSDSGEQGGPFRWSELALRWAGRVKPEKQGREILPRRAEAQIIGIRSSSSGSGEQGMGRSPGGAPPGGVAFLPLPVYSKARRQDAQHRAGPLQGAKTVERQATSEEDLPLKA